MQQDAKYPFYGWLLILGVILFGTYLLWSFKLFHHLLHEDKTYLSSFILVLFAAITAYLGLASWRLSQQRRLTQQLAYSASLNSSKNSPESWAWQHVELLQWSRKQATHESESVLARLVEQVHQGHTSGWFFSDILMRLGLIGTVIGFVLMLGTVYELKNSDVNALQHLLATMGGGMQVALYTTLTGLGSALLVAVQCQWLDRCADSLISEIITLGIKGK